MGISKLILKFTQGCKRPRKSQHNNEGEENSWRIKLPGFKTYQKAKILKTMLYGPKKKKKKKVGANRSMEENREPRNRSM